MARKPISADAYMAELNQRLKKHASYEKDMKFVPYPPGTSGAAMSGYSTVGPFGLIGVYAQIANEVNEEFYLA